MSTAALDLARGQVGVTEDAGPNRDAAGRIAGYRAPCVRHGHRLYLHDQPDAWCAAFASWCVWGSGRSPGDSPMPVDVATGWDARVAADIRAEHEPTFPPIGYRASVAELVADARATGTWRDVAASVGVGSDGEAPQTGDILVFGRDGQDPRAGGEGHCGFDAGPGEDGRTVLLSGNLANRVGLDALPIAGLVWVGWVRLEGSP